MKYQFPPELQKLVGDRMASGHYASEDELLRVALQALVDDEADSAAIRQAVAGMYAGDEGIPLDQAIADFRRRHGLADTA